MARSLLRDLCEFPRKELLSPAEFCGANPIALCCLALCLCYQCWFLTALKESLLVAVCAQSTRYHKPHPSLESALSICRTEATFSSNAECCLGFQQCPYLWSFKQVKPLTGSWLLQPQVVSGAIHCLLWYPPGQRRFCSSESLLLIASWSVKIVCHF